MAKFWKLWTPRTNCKDLFNTYLENSTEYDKIGYNVGSTIMALLPSLLSFAPIVTARIGLLGHLSHSHGVIAAAFTFGLPVVQLEVIMARSVTSMKKLVSNIGVAKRFLGIVQDAVPTAGEAASPTNPSMPPMPVDSTPTDDLPATVNGGLLLAASSGSSTNSPEIVCPQQRGNLSTSCHNDSKSFNDIAEDALSSIRKTAFGCNRPSIRSVQVMMLLFNVIHLGLVFCLIVIVLHVDPSTLIWDCRDTGMLTVGLLLGVLCLLGPLRMRFERKGFGATDIIHISKASNTMGTTYWSRLRDPHPMIVILRPSPNGILNLNSQGLKGERDLRVVFLIGVSQLCWILFLSFFFSSLMGGTPSSSLLSVWGFVVAVAISRGLSILTIWLVVKYIGLQVIEYNDSLELDVMRVLIGALPEAHVEVRGNPNSSWEKCYLQGQFTGCGLDFKSSSILVSACEVIPMLSALAVVAVVYYETLQIEFVFLFSPPFALVCLAKRREKCIVLRNREAGTDKA